MVEKRDSCGVSPVKVLENEEQSAPGRDDSEEANGGL
jgi:hypothetical protein